MNKRKLLTVPAFLLLLVISSGCDKNDTEPPRDFTITQKSATDNQVVVSFSAYDDLSH